MSKFKEWLFKRFLPTWCKEELIAENKKLVEALTAQRVEIGRLNAYIDGLENAMRAQRRVIIRNEVKP